jgi:hypothetical protein
MAIEATSARTEAPPPPAAKASTAFPESVTAKEVAPAEATAPAVENGMGESIDTSA